MKTFVKFAETQPHTSYAVFTHGLSSDWTYLFRTMPGVAPLLQPVEDVIRTELIPPKFGCGAPGDPKRAMLALPARLGGLRPTSTVHRTDCYDHSVNLTAPLAEQSKEQSLFLGDIQADQQLIKQQVHQERRSSWASYGRKPTQSIFNAKAPTFSVTCCRARSLDMALRFASRGSWLLSFKVGVSGRDAIHLCCGWPPYRQTYCNRNPETRQKLCGAVRWYRAAVV